LSFRYTQPYLPSFLTEKDPVAGRLTRILPDCRTEEMAIHAIYPSQRHLSAKARLFIDLLAEELQLRAGEGEGSSEQP